MMQHKQPHLLVFAGANGSGKSTVVDWYLQRNLCAGEYICPDQLVPKGKQNDRDAYLDAMRRGG
jgi:predicted ABC-type ATPase